MLIPRRSFVKGLSYLLGALPLPGVVKQAFASSEGLDKLEDVEMILKGLIARCVNGPITDKDAELMGKFLNRFDVAEEAAMMEKMGDMCRTDEDYRKHRGDPRWGTAVRFITGVTRGMRGCKEGEYISPPMSACKPWFMENFKKVNKTCMKRVVAVFNESPRVKANKAAGRPLYSR